MPAYVGVLFVHGKQRHIAGERPAHAIHQLVIGIQNGIPIGQDRFRHHPFYLGQLLNGMDALQAQVVGCHIGNDADITIFKPQAGPQQTAPGTFQNRKVNGWVFQDKLGTGRPGAIPGHQQPVLNVNAIGGGVPHLIPFHFYHVGDEPGGGGFSVGPRYRHDGDTGGRAGRVKHVYHAACDIPWQAFGR